MTIDSHQHFWKVERGDYPWMSPELGPAIYRDYLPADLRPLLARNGVDKTILVQAAPTLSETDFLLELAASCDFVAGVVGWLDFESEAFSDQWAAYRTHPLFVGVRPAVEFLPDDDWLARPDVLEKIGILAAADFSFDLVTWPRHLPAVLRLLETHSTLRCVFDHLCKPDIKNRVLEPWRSLMAEAAAYPNVHCKLSGLWTMADFERWALDDFRPYVDHVLHCFGMERVMFGSDWPICLQAATYEQAVQSVRALLGDEVPEQQPVAVFGGNAARFYRLEQE